ncbi:MAG TPA: TIGR01777 family oxidoreductase [Thermoanaerobaculia bacterium]|nr:TIGR01777 family oxidoreductase [Thermoanaerobaculia bacterium]
MRIVITGGTGLIGNALAREMGSAGHEVVVLTRDPARSGTLPPGTRAVRWDGRTAGDWAKLLDGDTVIVHLAGDAIAVGRWTDEKKRRIRESRVESGRAVLEAVRQAKSKPRALLQGSAVGYYGDTGDAVVTESHPPGDDFLARVCVEWEASTAEVTSFGVRRPVLRTGIVLSSQGGALPRMALPFRMLAGGPLGNGRQWLAWIHEMDEVGAIRFLIEREDADGPFNLTAPAPLPNRDFSRALGEALHRPSFAPAPGFALRLLLGEMADALLHGQRAVPRKLLDLGYVFRYPEALAALRGLLP